ncbi:hypothetical protein C1T31_07610 [Hanstruepera neustonica]|uniref:Uncharacterized protein n=1 Tax=Hanstruepera neustonica TaxID=1445657 RepID=A0A2K1DZE8_9FLAO|nr:hypothetical protein [Hanstruepera neustonica]PNQ73374.1 hypothetical protein C1T31_07610 [Hanstruepera neustonica]
MNRPWENSPIFQKAESIRKLADSIVEIAMESEMFFETEEDGKMIDNSINYLVDNSLIIPANIAEVWDEETPYDLKMENATSIRMAAREILSSLMILEDFGFKDIEYLNVLREEMEEFRVLFAEWVKTFDPWNYIIDRWGLFNPPGVNYDDPNPDDDIHFNGDEDDIDED